MKIFKVSYKVVRENSDEIYKGFGFRHLSDATQYYVHPANQSYGLTTTLCQPIGESVITVAGLLQSMNEGAAWGDYYVKADGSQVYLEMTLPNEYRYLGVVESNIYRYRALSEGTHIALAAYDEKGRFLPGAMDHLRPLYKLLPAFAVLLGREMLEVESFRTSMEEFALSPVADTFVNLHEDFYQNHKNVDYELSYEDFSLDLTTLTSYMKQSANIRANKKSLAVATKSSIASFAAGSFTAQQLEYVPHLGPEFILSPDLNTVASAIAKGDILTVLLHGPAGTGKTMAVKLIAQAIGLPIMATINCTENLDEFVLGKYLPDSQGITFHESPVTEAIRSGGAVVFEEINFGKPQYMAFLNSLLDDNGFVRLDNGEIVRRHENFRFFATMNRGYFGTQELNQALYNRFNCIAELAVLPDEAIVRMLTKRVPSSEQMVGKMLGVYHKLQKKIQAEELDLVISPRNLENWARLAQYEGYLKAAERTIIPIAKGDKTFEETIRGILFLYKWK